MKNSPVNNNSRFEKHAAIGTFVTIRRMLLKMSLLVPAMLLNLPVPAQETNAPHAADELVSARKLRGLDKRVELLARYLDLSEEQRSTLKKILFETQREILKLRLAPSTGESLQMDRFRAIEDNTAEKIRAMLTEEQRKRYDPLSMRDSNPAAQKVGVEDWLKGIGTR